MMTETVVTSTDFSRIAPYYDESRNLPEPVLESAYARLSAQGILQPGAKILDLGCGTGQVSLPLVKMGYSVTGVDISTAMMQRYLAKLPTNSDLNLSLLSANAIELPFADNTFDLVFASKLFEHIQDWRRAVTEVMRVSKHYFIAVGETGFSSNIVRQQAQFLAAEMGYSQRFLGVTGWKEFNAYFQEKGCLIRQIDTQDLHWEKELRYEEIFKGLQNRLFAEFWYMRDGDYALMLEGVNDWLEKQAQSRQTVEITHPSLIVWAYAKS